MVCADNIYKEIYVISGVEKLVPVCQHTSRSIQGVGKHTTATGQYLRRVIEGILQRQLVKCWRRHGSSDTHTPTQLPHTTAHSTPSRYQNTQLWSEKHKIAQPGGTAQNKTEHSDVSRSYLAAACISSASTSFFTACGELKTCCSATCNSLGEGSVWQAGQWQGKTAAAAGRGGGWVCHVHWVRHRHSLPAAAWSLAQLGLCDCVFALKLLPEHVSA